MRLCIPRMLLLAGAVSVSACDDEADRSSAERSIAAAPALRAATPVAAWTDTDPPELADPRRFLDQKPMRWADWETQPPADRFARLRELGIAPIRRDTLTRRVEDEYGEPDGERAEDYHFVDFSGDGVADVIYDGTFYMVHEGRLSTAEATHVKLFQVIGGRAVEVFEHHGAVERLWKGRPGEPASLLVTHGEHCMDEEWSLAFFRPVRAGGRVGYEPYRYLVGTEDIELPRQFASSRRRFTVDRDGYLLRSSPEIDTSTYGNAMAVYPRGARGIAHAERRDATGRVWWFVRMDGRTPPTEARPREEDPSSPVRTDRVGWMSSRFLSVVP